MKTLLLCLLLAMTASAKAKAPKHPKHHHIIRAVGSAVKGAYNVVMDVF